MNSWSVVATVNESPGVLNTFVEYHLNQGCSLVYLYFDDPQDNAKDLFLTNPRVVVRDSAQNVGSHERKQSTNATHAYQRCETQWLAHIDADEFIHCDSNVGEALASLSNCVVQLTLQPWEGVYRSLIEAQIPFSTDLFRGRLWPIKESGILQSRFYPKAGDMLKWGLSGHAIGKSFVRRTAAAMNARIHFWQYLDSEAKPQSQTADEKIRLLHFDAISIGEWKRKLLRRIERKVVMKGMDPHRLSQLRAFDERSTPGSVASIEELFEALYVLSPETLRNPQAARFVRTFNWAQPA